MKRTRAAAIVVHGDRILLMRRIKKGKEYFTFPGGGVENGETPEEATIREILEETTVHIKIEKLLYRLIFEEEREEFFYLSSYNSGEPKLDPNSIEQKINKTHDSKENFFEPLWKDISEIPDLLLYPLEVRDWFLEDQKKNFKVDVREEHYPLSALPPKHSE
jgi:8-oxo-dGTP diphosphatase